MRARGLLGSAGDPRPAGAGPYRPRAPEGRRPKGAARVPGPGHLLSATSYRPHHRFFSVQHRYVAVTRAIARRCAWFYAAACFLFNRERLNHCISIGSSVRFRRSHHASPMCIGSGASRCCATTKRAIFLQDYLTKQGEYEFPSISLALPHAVNLLDQCPPGMSFQLDIWFVWFCASSPNVHR